MRLLGVRGEQGWQQRRRLRRVLTECGCLHRRQVQDRSRHLERLVARAQWQSVELAALLNLSSALLVPYDAAAAAAAPNASASGGATGRSSSVPEALEAEWRRALGRREEQTLEATDVRSRDAFFAEMTRALMTARAQVQMRAAVMYSHVSTGVALLCQEVLERCFNATSDLSSSLQVSAPPRAVARLG